MLCGGEALPRSLADRLLPKGKALWNLYGPTETTIWSAALAVEAGDGPILIGKPIAQTQLYVLDARLRPVPVGVAGELYIGGAGLARGYLNRPGLTAERFVADPLGSKPGAGCTGPATSRAGMPMGRSNASAGSTIRSRSAASASSWARSRPPWPAILGSAQVVAVAREDAAGEQALVAYSVPRAGPVPTVADLRKAIAAGLPDYMIPSAFVLLDEFPLTPNGKVDRNALPAPDGRAARRPASTSRRGTRSRKRSPPLLAKSWVATGSAPATTSSTSGGHSLMAAQLLARLRDAFGVEIPLKDLFENSNVAALAHRVEDALRSQSGEVVPPIELVDRSAPLPASFAQQRLWFLDQLEPNQATYNLPVAVRLRGKLDHASLREPSTSWHGATSRSGPRSPPSTGGRSR